MDGRGSLTQLLYRIIRTLEQQVFSMLIKLLIVDTEKENVVAVRGSDFETRDRPFDFIRSKSKSWLGTDQENYGVPPLLTTSRTCFCFASHHLRTFVLYFFWQYFLIQSCKAGSSFPFLYCSA